MYSFERNKPRVELQAYVRKIADLTTPNLPFSLDHARADDRQNRVLPVLVLPRSGSDVTLDEPAFAVTKDICDNGISVVSSTRLDMEDALIVVWLAVPHHDIIESEPFLFFGTVRQCTDIGGGYWQIGLEMTEVVKSRKLVRRIEPLAERLLPESVRGELFAEP